MKRDQRELIKVAQSLIWRYFLKFLWATLRTSPWIILTHLMTKSSRASSSLARAPALKKTRVCPSLYLSLSNPILSMRAYVAVLLSEDEAISACPKQAYLIL